MIQVGGGISITIYDAGKRKAKGLFKPHGSNGVVYNNLDSNV
jgi:hypothetical protein